MKKKQIYIHDYSKVEYLIDDIFNRQYYTNHGPLGVKLENSLESFYSKNDSILAMANFDISLLISLLSLNLDHSKKVLLPSLVDKSIINCLRFMKLNYEIEEVNTETGLLNFSKNKYENISLLLVFNSLGLSKPKSEVFKIAKKSNVPVIFISKHSFGVFEEFIENDLPTFIEIFDFSSLSILNGGVVAGVRTNDKGLAEKLRNIRSSYGARKKVEIPFTGNGRMSEVQSGLILLSLENLEETIWKNKVIYKKKLNLCKDGFTIINFESLNLKTNYSLTIVKVKKNTNNNMNFINDQLFRPIDFGLIALNTNAQNFLNSTLVSPSF